MELFQTQGVSTPNSTRTDSGVRPLVNPDAPPVDSETAALFRAALYPLISQSGSWPALMDALRDKGFGLAFRDGRLFLTNHNTGARICSFRFLGMPLRDMVSQLGRPIVRALPGRTADGEVLRETPKPSGV